MRLQSAIFTFPDALLDGGACARARTRCSPS